ncbi:MAG: ABC transporter substrate-binding protein [Dehalococcoidia bacterium]
MPSSWKSEREPRWQNRLDRREVLRRGGLSAFSLAAGLFWLNCSGGGTGSSSSGGSGASSAASLPPPPANPGGRVPAMGFAYPTGPTWDESLRKFIKDWRDLGMEFKIQPLSNTEWLDAIFARRYGDIETHGSPVRPERFDPTEWVVSRAYGPEGEVGKRNYGNYKSKEYDKYVNIQLKEADLKKRQEAVFKAQEVLAQDFYTNTLVFPKLAEAYNADDWDIKTKPVVGSGLLGDLVPYGLLEVTPKTSRRRFVRGQRTLMDTSNIVATTGGGRNILRLVYDTIVKLDKDLNVTAWAAESWRQVDDVTWEIKLRPGMRFHDGQPVTPEDVRWTFDQMMQQKPGILSLVWSPIAKVEITDPSQGVLRFTLKEPQAQFLTIMMMIAFILPKHVWEEKMRAQGVSKLVDLSVLDASTGIGSGPFRWVEYRKDEQFLLSANRQHFAQPKIDELLYLISPTVDGNIGRLQTKAIDVFEITSKSTLDEAAKFKHVKTQVTDSIGWELVLPFIEKQPWRDIELRKAWFYSTDKKYVVDVVYEGLATASTSGSFLAPFGPWGNPNLPAVPYDMKLARETLAKARYSWDSQGRLLYPPDDDQAFKERVQQVLSRPNDWWGPPVEQTTPPDGRPS